jgi:hypothetical protein
MFKYSTVKNCCAKRKKGRGERRFKVQRDDALAQQEQPTTPTTDNRQRDVNRQHNNYVKVLSANFGIVYSIHYKIKD